MKALITALVAIAAVFNVSVNAAAPIPPDIKLQGSNNLNPSGSIVINEGTIRNTIGSIQSGTVTVGVPFVATASITSAAAATAVPLLADAAVPTGKKVYITSYHVYVNGATNWATTATVKIQDTNSTPVDFSTIAVAAMTGNTLIVPSTSNVTNGNAFLLGTGGTAGKGLQLKGNANGTGSTAVVTVTGFIK